MKSIFLTLILMGLSIGFSSAAQDSGPKKTVKVDGQGVVAAEPDQATIRVTIKEEGDSLKDLVEKNKTKMANILTTLKSFKIPEKDMQTAQYSINRKYKYVKGTTLPDGYSVTNQLKVVLKDTTQAGDVLGALSDSDDVQIDGPTFGFSNPAKLQLEALKAAVENAHSKAAVLAESTGTELGPVLSMEQTGVSMPTIRTVTAMAAFSGAAPSTSVPVEQGTDQVTAQIEVVYTLK
jgi:uncharacterized protein YggE